MFEKDNCISTVRHEPVGQALVWCVCVVLILYMLAIVQKLMTFIK